MCFGTSVLAKNNQPRKENKMLRYFEKDSEDPWVRVDLHEESPATRLASTSKSSPRPVDTQPRHINHVFACSGPGSRPNREDDAQMHLSLYWETMQTVACA